MLRKLSLLLALGLAATWMGCNKKAEEKPNSGGTTPAANSSKMDESNSEKMAPAAKASTEKPAAEGEYTLVTLNVPNMT